MDDIMKRTLLFDFYSELLTDKQKKIYTYYYLEDLSLAEIAENMGISRQGVHDAVKRCEKQLLKYEDKLKMVEKYLNNKKRVNDILELSQDIGQKVFDDALKLEINQLEDKIKEILDEM